MNSASPETPSINPENQYDIAVIGHANVDIFFTLSEEDPDWRLNTKTNELSFKYGEKVAVKEAQYAMGGNGQNVAVGLARLGYRVALLEEVGGDAFAQDILKNLEDNQVETKYLNRVAEKRTSMGVVMNVKGDRTILSQHVEHRHEVNLQNIAPRLIYLTSLGPVWEDAYTSVLDFASQNGVPIAFNPGSSQLNQLNDVVLRAIKQSHILCINLDEAKTILHHQHPRSKTDKLSIEDIMGKIAELGPKIVVITDGKNGSYARAEDGRCFQQDILPANVVERTGAGDSFTAGLLGAALSGKSLQKAMYWGAKNAASVVGQVGSEPGLLTLEQMEAEVDPLLVNLGLEQPMHVFHFGHSDVVSQRLFAKNADQLEPSEVEQLNEAYAVMYDAVKEASNLGVPKSDIVVEVSPKNGDAILQLAQKDNIASALTLVVGDEIDESITSQLVAQWLDKYHMKYLTASVQFNPAEQVATRKSKKAMLRLLCDSAHQLGVKFILDLDVPPHEKQLSQVKGDVEIYNRSLKNDITVKAIAEFQQAGIEPDGWRFEYTSDANQYRQLLKEMQKSDYQNRVSSVLSGEEATDEQLKTAMQEFAQAPQVIGYAAGTHIYKDAVADYLSQEASRLQAKNRIAQEFLYLYQSYREAVTPLPPTPAQEVVEQPEPQNEADNVEVISADHVEPSPDTLEPTVDSQPTEMPDRDVSDSGEEAANPFRPATTDEEWEQPDEDRPSKSGMFSRLFKR